VWLASKILGSHTAGGPFGKPLAEYSAVELDFVLEMAAIDEPERYTFVRDGKVSGVSQVAQELADWTKCLEGPALARHLANSFVPPAWTKRPKPESGMTVGITRGGKAIDAGRQNNG
jgi:hypothetical protein